MPKPKKKVVTKSETREIVYPEIDARVAIGEGALTVEQAKGLLGWESETDYIARITGGMTDEEKSKADVKFGSDYALVDEDGEKVRLYNNVGNRPLTEDWARALAKDILDGNWRFNGESIVIGKTGRVLSAQHRLVGLVLAGQVWSDPDKDLGKGKWESEPVLESVLVYGVPEDPETTRTLDNVKPRSLSDVLFADTTLFGDLKASARKFVCRMTDYATRQLWKRTGANKDAFSPQRTHSEMLDFIDRHKRILEAVKHVYEECQREVNLTKWISPGYAAGLLYLMGCSNSDGDEYREKTPASEKKLDWSNWDKACEFWTLFADGAELKDLRYAIKNLQQTDDGPMGSMRERQAVIVKAWNDFIAGKKLRSDKLQLKVSVNDDGIRSLLEDPTLGGIDLGYKGGETEEEAGAETESEGEEGGEEEATPNSSPEREAFKKKVAKQVAEKRKAESTNPRKGVKTMKKAPAAAEETNGATEEHEEVEETVEADA